jgi:SAM-dependent methyltransferase
MELSNLKKAYLRSRMSNNGLTREREQAGVREVQTLKMLAAEVGFAQKVNLNLLDLGCGDKFLKPAAQAEGWKYIGLDYSNIDFEFNKFPLEENSVDIAISLAVIEHLESPESFMSEIFRCLKPGGLVYISTPNFQLDWKNFYNDPTHVHPYTPISIETLLKLHGFTSIATFPGLRCKNINWYRGANRFLKAYYLLPFSNETKFPVPRFLKGHARSIFGIAKKPMS